MTQIIFPADHPAAAGHFPGNPIIPGAALLDEILSAMAIEALCQIRAAKFLHPIRPGEAVRLNWQGNESEIRFECRLGDNGPLVLTGIINL